MGKPNLKLTSPTSVNRAVGLFAGIGVNMISHILMTHLTDAEKKFDSEHK
jgi:hypothetical protein